MYALLMGLAGGQEAEMCMTDPALQWICAGSLCVAPLGTVTLHSWTHGAVCVEQETGTVP